MSLGPISGRELAEQVHSLEFKAIYQRHVAPSPGRALDAIKERFDSRPTADGHSNPAIAEIRRILAASATTPAALNGLMITAPHSHWHDGRPIIVRFDSDLIENEAGRARLRQRDLS